MRTQDELFYFVAGVTVGVIAALLVAPYSGEETRRYLRDRVEEGRERAEDMLERGKDFVGSQADTVSGTVGLGRRNYQEKI
jgi:gas vesicle protein